MTPADKSELPSPRQSDHQIDAALKWSHQDAMERHRKAHGPVAVWLDGRVQMKRVFFAVPGDPFALPPKKAS